MTAAHRNGARAKAPTKATARAKTPSKPKAKPKTTRTKVKPSGLTDLEERFALEYLKDQNGSRAYRVIKPHVTDKTAGAECHKLLKKPEMQAFIAERTKTIATRMELSVERTMQEIARLAYFDPRKLFDADGRPIAINQLDDDTAAAIAGVDVVTVGNADMGFGEIRKLKVADKNAALEKAAKILGLFKKDNEQTGDALASALTQFVAQFHGQDSGRLRVNKG
jgi:phage terminase small subunit